MGGGLKCRVAERFVIIAVNIRFMIISADRNFQTTVPTAVQRCIAVTMAKPLFTPEELEEMRLADEEIEAKFSLTSEEREASNYRDRITRIDNSFGKERLKRKLYEDNREKINERNKEKYWTNPEAARAKSKKYRDANKEKEAERKRRWYEANREKVREHQLAYRDANRERYNEMQRLRQKKYYQQNRDVALEMVKKYRTENKEVLAAKRKEYYQKNREKIIARQKEYYARKKAEQERRNADGDNESK
jgi:hypothetical protein